MSLQETTFQDWLHLIFPYSHISWQTDRQKNKKKKTTLQSIGTLSNKEVYIQDKKFIDCQTFLPYIVLQKLKKKVPHLFCQTVLEVLGKA